jgi:hypothetical protein
VYKFIHVDKGVLRKLPTELYEFLWMPMLMARLPDCRPRDSFLFDCIFTELTENPYTTLMLLSKVPQKTRVVDEMPFSTKRVANVVCSAVNIMKNLNAMAGEVVRDDYSRLYQIIERVAEFKDAVISYRVFLRTRRYVIPAEKVKESTFRIASRSTRKALEYLCCIEKGVVKSTAVEAQPVYTLAFFSKDFSDGGIVVDKKVIRLKSLAKLVKIFEEQLAKLIEEQIKPC